ncbi:MAG: cyclase [Planctomycetota bacterium]
MVGDSQLPGSREDVVSGVLESGEGQVRYLINTHWHGDHVSNNLQIAGDVPVLSHTNVRRRLVCDSTIGGRVGGNAPPGAWPHLTYDDSIALHLDGEEIEVRHYASVHTDGDSVVFFKTSGVVHMGDLFFNGLFPFIDVQSGGGVQGVIDAVESILKEVGEMKIIPGHGPLATRADLETYLAMLKDCKGRVERAIADGKEALEMRDAGLVDDYAKDWALGFIGADRFIDLLYASLSR